MKAMILAAGYGTRLRPITYTIPKPLIPICNQPIIAYALASLLRHGISEVIINLHHLPDDLEQYVTEGFGDRATVHFSYEAEILGTSGGIRNVRALLEGDDDFFVINGDTIQDASLARLRARRRETDAIAALSLRHSPENDRFTPAFADGGWITGFGHGKGEALMFSGAQCISSRIFGHIPETPFSGIIEDVYQPLLDGGKERIAAVVDDGLWFDIGTPERYLAASREMAERMSRGEIDVPGGSRAARGNVIHETAGVTGKIHNSTVGADSIVSGSLYDCSVWENCTIAGGVILESCIVCPGVVITEPIELARSTIYLPDARIPREGARLEEGVLIAGFR